jgi:hypothetical protein
LCVLRINAKPNELTAYVILREEIVDVRNACIASTTGLNAAVLTTSAWADGAHPSVTRFSDIANTSA